MIEVVPTPLKALLVALALLATVLGVTAALTRRRARRLRRQREQLAADVGLLQGALLPQVPERVGRLAVSVSYRPAEGPAAGGDFYDAFTLDRGRAAIIVGDVSGHGHAALSRTAVVRHSLHAYLQAGLAPSAALRLTSDVLQDGGDSDFTTAVVAVHDPREGTLTYACAGHPAPIVLGPGAHEPIVRRSAPPLGVGLATGTRETTIALPAGATACLYTDGVVEARTDSELLGRERLISIVAELGRRAAADAVLERVAAEADELRDDMAVCVVRALSGARSDARRVEKLEVRAGAQAHSLERFMHAAGIGRTKARASARAALALAAGAGAALIRVELVGERADVSVLPAVAAQPHGALAQRGAGSRAP